MQYTEVNLPSKTERDTSREDHIVSGGRNENEEAKSVAAKSVV